jgi:glycosyltransferase involved in cell wall biosynthesis
MRSLDIIQPCYNPPEGWDKNTIHYFFELKKLMPEVPIQLIIVNDGSIKPIAEEAIQLIRAAIPSFTYLSYELNQGKGYALRFGAKAASSDFQIYTDIDFPYQIKHIKEIYDLLVAGADVVAGCRDEEYYTHLSWKRWVTSKMSQLLNSIFLRLPNPDTQSGLKGFSSKGRSVFLRTTINRFLCDAEFLVLSNRTPGIRLQYLPLKLREKVSFSSMSLKIIIQEMGNLIRISLKN